MYHGVREERLLKAVEKRRGRVGGGVLFESHSIG